MHLAEEDEHGGQWFDVRAEGALYAVRLGEGDAFARDIVRAHAWDNMHGDQVSLHLPHQPSLGGWRLVNLGLFPPGQVQVAAHPPNPALRRFTFPMTWPIGHSQALHSVAVESEAGFYVRRQQYAKQQAAQQAGQQEGDQRVAEQGIPIDSDEVYCEKYAQLRDADRRRWGPAGRGSRGKGRAASPAGAAWVHMRLGY